MTEELEFDPRNVRRFFLVDSLWTGCGASQPPILSIKVKQPHYRPGKAQSVLRK
jgi:hypothetical protein